MSITVSNPVRVVFLFNIARARALALPVYARISVLPRSPQRARASVRARLKGDLILFNHAHARALALQRWR